MVDKGRHRHIHVGMSLVDRLPHFIDRFGNNPTFTTKHTTDISLKLVQGMVDGLLAKDSPCPTFSVLGKHLTQTEPGVLILKKNSTGVNKLLSILGKHAIHSGGIIHVRKRITVSREGIADLLQFVLDRDRLVKNDKDTLLRHLTSFRVRDGLLDGSKSDITVTTSGTENHTFKTGLLFGRNNTRDGGETHIHITSIDFFAVVQKTSGTIIATSCTGASGSEFRHRQTRGIRHEETTRLFQHFLKLDFFIVFQSQLFGVGIQFAQLSFVSLQFNFQCFQKLSTSLIITIGQSRLIQKGVGSTSTFNFQTKLITFSSKVTKFAFKFVATLHVGNVTTLKGSQIRIQVGELNNSKLSQVSKTAMSCVLVNNEGDILHGLRTEPFRHF
mmetsp:Transcript_17802/g.27494  ORF Transcript_17802/g.27494 Transcript_17802/m.27494 type:complete len:385 (+) Transcript_17802:1625-2779(+)